MGQKQSYAYALGAIFAAFAPQLKLFSYGKWYSQMTLLPLATIGQLMGFARPKDDAKLSKAMDMLDVSELSNTRLTTEEQIEFAFGYYRNKTHEK